MLEKAAALKRFENSPLGKELKNQTGVAEKQYQKLNNAFESNKNEENKTKSEISPAKSDLAYNNYFTFYKYHNIKEFTKPSPDLKLNDLKEPKDELELFYYENKDIKPNSEYQDKDLGKRKVVINATSKLYVKILNIYTTHYNKLSEDQKKRVNVVNRPEN